MNEQNYLFDKLNFLIVSGLVNENVVVDLYRTILVSFRPSFSQTEEVLVTDGTLALYIIRTHYFFKKFGLLGNVVTVTDIISALILAARDKSPSSGNAMHFIRVQKNIQLNGYSKSSWYQLKTAIVNALALVGLHDISNLVSDTKPDIQNNNFHKPIRKVRRISKEQFVRIYTSMFSVEGSLLPKYYFLCHVVVVLYYTGCRPCELLKMEADSKSCTVSIVSAKKNKTRNRITSKESFARGIDRSFSLSEEVTIVIEDCLDYLRSEGFLPKTTDDLSRTQRDQYLKKINVLGKTFSRLSKKTLGLRKGMCLTTFRHQLCSELKGDANLSPTKVAYIMGHMATGSQSVYGNGRFRTKGGRKHDITVDVVPDTIRITHTTIQKQNGITTFVSAASTLSNSINTTANSTPTFRP